MDPQVEANVAPEPEPFLGTLDIILLAALFAGAVWYLLKKRAAKEEQPERSYSIQ